MLRQLLHPISITPVHGCVRVRAGETTLGQSRRALALDEPRAPVRYYLPREDVRMDLLERSGTARRCPWKGPSTYFSTPVLEDVAWSYEEPSRQVAEIEGLIAFDGARSQISVH